MVHGPPLPVCKAAGDDKEEQDGMSQFDFTVVEVKHQAFDLSVPGFRQNL